LVFKFIARNTKACESVKLILQSWTYIEMIQNLLSSKNYGVKEVNKKTAYQKCQFPELSDWV
jgi:hypothetical protein